MTNDYGGYGLDRGVRGVWCGFDESIKNLAG